MTARLVSKESWPYIRGMLLTSTYTIDWGHVAETVVPLVSLIVTVGGVVLAQLSKAKVERAKREAIRQAELDRVIATLAEMHKATESRVHREVDRTTARMDTHLAEFHSMPWQ